MRNKGMVVITAVMISMGAMFGSAEVVMIAFCGQHGSRASAGWVLAAFAGGSAVAGILYGARHWRQPLRRRFVTCALIFAVLPLLYFLAQSIVMLAVITAIVGLGAAPTLIGGFGLVDSIVPKASLTEGLTWIGTGLAVGYGLGAAFVGGIADAHGARAAFVVPASCGLISGVCALVLIWRLHIRGEDAPRALEPLAIGSV